MTVSIIILTHKRPNILRELLKSLRDLKNILEIIVVDNNSQDNTEEIVRRETGVTYLKIDTNIGTAARNLGIDKASGDILVCLDDDIIGIDQDALSYICSKFSNSPNLGALCFKILDFYSGELMNWCHHYDPKFSDQEFITDVITEGAVAFRARTLKKSGYYPKSFFIAHEGVDLAYRILNKGDLVIYSPKVVVKHHYAQDGREDWRAYYYGARNHIWLAARNYPLSMAVKYLFVGLGSNFIYSIRDGYFKYWCKAIYDGIKGLPQALQERTKMTEQTLSFVKEINKHHPGFLYMAKKRLFKKGMRI